MASDKPYGQLPPVLDLMTPVLDLMTEVVFVREVAVTWKAART